MDENNILNYFTRDLFDSIHNIDNDKLRFSKKRKIDEITYMVDDESIIYDSASETEDDENLIEKFNYYNKPRQYKKYVLQRGLYKSLTTF
jgi:hypothetical protein